MVRWLERNGYDVSYFSGRRHRPARRRDPRAQDLPVGRPRRVLVGAAARQRRGRARRRRQPRVLQRQRGVLEDALGAEHRRHGDAVPHPRLLQGDARRTRRSTRARSGPAPGATRASARRPTAAGPRTRSPARSSRSTACATTRSRSRPQTARCASGGTRASQPRRRRAVATLADRHARATSGTRTSDNGFRPAGLVQPVDHDRRITDGKYLLRTTARTYATGTATHHLTLYRAPERRAGVRRRHRPVVLGPRRPDHDRRRPTPDVRMQQATVNLFADMGVQPATLQAGLVAADAVDRHASRRPSTITVADGGPAVDGGTPVTITGTATDAGGGVVGGVEVSTDGGATWHPAIGRDELDLRVDARSARARPRSESARSTTAATSERRRARRHGQRREPELPVLSIWAAPRTPPVTSTSGHRHRRARRQVPDRRAPGTITGVRFYKGAANTGHARRQPLDAHRDAARDRAPSSGETASGWQQVNFATPVAVTRRTRPTSRRTTRRPAATPSTSATSPPAATNSAAARARQRRRRRQRRLRVRPRPAFPTQTLFRRELLGRRRLPAGPLTAPARVQPVPAACDGRGRARATGVTFHTAPALSSVVRYRFPSGPCTALAEAQPEVELRGHELRAHRGARPVEHHHPELGVLQDRHREGTVPTLPLAAGEERRARRRDRRAPGAPHRAAARRELREVGHRRALVVARHRVPAVVPARRRAGSPRRRTRCRARRRTPRRRPGRNARPCMLRWPKL